MSAGCPALVRKLTRKASSSPTAYATSDTKKYSRPRSPASDGSDGFRAGVHPRRRRPHTSKRRQKHTSNPGTTTSPSPSNENGNASVIASPTSRGNKSLVGPSVADDVATVIITLDPTTASEPKTQNASYANSPRSRVAAAGKEASPTSCKRSAAMHAATRLFKVKFAGSSTFTVAAEMPRTSAAARAGLASNSRTGSPSASISHPSGTESVRVGSAKRRSRAPRNSYAFPPTAKQPSSQKYRFSSAERSIVMYLRARKIEKSATEAPTGASNPCSNEMDSLCFRVRLRCAPTYCVESAIAVK
mmetsp:Transcript_23230/g.75666  ORF Transcript_23230/g.75666 Transcript_23230/m.75666 type:complete len:303 (-) Transcript_23230:358-1266(-)